MNLFCYFKLKPLTFFVLLIFSSSSYCQDTTSTPIIESEFTSDSLGIVFYKKWRSTKIDSNLVMANAHFITAYNLKDRQLKFKYAIDFARLLVKDTAQNMMVKDWYFRAFSSYNFKLNNKEKSLTPVQRAVERYYIMYEFVGIYADIYGKCEDALETLREHKTEFYFDYVKKKGKEKGYDRIWHDLTKKDHTIHTYCKNK